MDKMNKDGLSRVTVRQDGTWHRDGISALSRLRGRSEAGLGYIVRLSLPSPKNDASMSENKHEMADGRYVYANAIFGS